MLIDFAKLQRTLAYSLLAAGLALAIGVGTARAGKLITADQIIKALTPKTPSRNFTFSPAEPERNTEETQLLNSLKNITRSFTYDEREKLDRITQNKPKLDFDINFEYNSAKLTPEAMSQAREIGKALSSANFKGSTVVINGHTDAKGGDAFNQRLSEQRAQAVKRFLVETSKIPATNLMAVGYGKTKLKTKDDPFGPENRRVEVVNMADNVANK